MYQPRVGERCERLRDGQRGFVCKNENPAWVEVKLDPNGDAEFMTLADLYKGWRWIPSLGTRVYTPQGVVEEVTEITRTTIAVSSGGGRPIKMTMDAFMRDYRRVDWPRSRAA